MKLAPELKGERKNLIFDFDSTLVAVESLDELALIALRDQPDKDARQAEIRRITALGMEGKLPFSESLSRRMMLFSATQENIDELIELLRHSIAPSVARNRSFFEEHQEEMYLLSSGFREYITPIAEWIGFLPERVIANSFVFDEAGRVTGADLANPLMGDKGKVAALASLGLSGTTFIIGDGYTDYEIRKEGRADAFIAFTENVARAGIVEKADYRVANMEELIYLLGIPPA